MSILKVAILGGGPAAAFVFQACKEHKCSTTIYADRLAMGGSAGAFILEMVPADIAKRLTRDTVYISGEGQAHVYSQKQWGFPHHSTSFPEKDRIATSYNPAEVFPNLWIDADDCWKRSGFISDKEIEDMAPEYDFIFCTFPTEKIKSTKAITRIPVMIDAVTPHRKERQNWIIYDGHEKCEAVRMSKLFGHTYVEYPTNWKPDNMTSGTWGWQPELPPTVKPWDLTDTPAGNVFLVGRYAQLERHMQSNEAYTRANELLLGIANE